MLLKIIQNGDVLPKILLTPPGFVFFIELFRFPFVNPPLGVPFFFIKKFTPNNPPRKGGPFKRPHSSKKTGKNLIFLPGAEITSWEDVIEELPTEIRAELFPVEATTRAERASLFENALSPVEKKIFSLLGTDESIHVDELVEKAELNSSEVLAALCEMEMKGIVRQMPGKQFLKILL